MAEDNQVPEHRTAVTPRSGDTHVIGEDGAAVNVDQAARDADAAKTEKAAKPKPVKTETDGKTDPVT